MIGIDAHDGDLTRVELTWVEGRTEYWIRFGHEAGTQILDRNRRVVSFGPGSVFAFVRWAANDHGTIISRLDILRAVAPGESSTRLSPASEATLAAPSRISAARSSWSTIT